MIQPDEESAMTSLQGRVSRRLLIPALLLMLLAGVLIGTQVQTQMRRLFDEALLFQAQSIVANVEHEAGGLELDIPLGLMAHYDRTENPAYYQLWTQRGAVIAGSPSLGSDLLTFSNPALQQPRYQSAPLPDGRPGRVVTVRFMPRQELDESGAESDGAGDTDLDSPHGQVFPMPYEPVVLSVSNSDQPYRDLVWRTWAILFGVFVLLMAAIAWLSREALRRGLEPLTDIRGQIMALDVANLDTRLAPKESVAELDGIVRQTNEMLERLESSFRRERQFSHDVAHELRTPLAELRNIAEVGTRWPEDRELVERLFRDAIGASVQMEHTLANLLSLARAEGDLDSLEQSRFYLDAIVHEVWARVCTSMNADSSRLLLDGAAGYQLSSARHHWALILQNLLNNAVAHGVAGSPVCVVLRPGTGENSDSLTIENGAQGVELSDLALVFDRMWRKESSRSQRHHAGLGLSLVKAYTDQLGLQVEASLPSELIFRITVIGLRRAGSSREGGQVSGQLSRPEFPGRQSGNFQS